MSIPNGTNRKSPGFASLRLLPYTILLCKHMKRITTVALWICAILVSATVAFAQSTFEGRIVYSITADIAGGGAMEMVCSLKGEKVRARMDMGGSTVDMYLREDGKSVVAVVMGQVMEMSAPQVTAPTEKDFAITPTGKKETINGYASEEHVVKSEEGEVSAWVTKDIERESMDAVLKALKFVSDANASAKTQAAYDELAKTGVIPVRMVMQTEQGKVTIDLVKIEKVPLSDDLFVVPAGLDAQKMTPGVTH
jgi:hypothetical protein